jgi:N-acetylmuramoyl-L-alanine amidase
LSDRPVLRTGATGSAVAELRRCLADAGLAGVADGPEQFGSDTEHAVREFQVKRGLRVDGVCGPETWNALIESGYQLGDRLLYLSRPFIRGDDVATLQRRLNMLGFHAGREDGIFGPQTERALREFQLNFGLTVDGQCGRSTLLGLDQVGSMSDGSAASVREREALRRDPRRLGSRQLYVAADPELARLGAAVARGLLVSGARVLLGSGRPDSTLADEANRYTADFVIALRAGDEPGSRVTYYATPTFRSERGYSLAVRIAEALAPDFGPVVACGRAYGILRETRMAAVEYQPAGRDERAALEAAAAAPVALVDAIICGVRRGVEEPLH